MKIKDLLTKVRSAYVYDRSNKLPDSFVKSRRQPIPGLKGQNILAQGNTLGRFKNNNFSPVTALQTAALAVLLLMFVTGENLIWAESIAERVIEGNRLLADSDLEGAMARYMDARTDSPESPELNYNIGNVYFHQSKVDQAIQSYRSALPKCSPELKIDTLYNLGNSLYEKVKQKESSGNLREALENAKTSLDYYKQARQTRKTFMGKKFKEDPDLNHNIQFVQREIRRIRDKILKQMKEQQKNKDQQQKEQQNQQQQQQQQQQSASQDHQKKEEQEKQAKTEQQEQQKKDQQQQQAQQMTPEQAKALLQQLSEKEKEQMKKRAIRMPGGSYYTDKDW